MITFALVSCSDQSNSAKNADVASSTNVEDGSLFGLHCAKCHGPSAQGSEEIGAPNLAVLPKWYLRMQLKKFQSGTRGYHEGDTSGNVMREAVKGIDLMTLESIVMEVNQFTPESSMETIKGDVKNGAELYRDHCMACHRFNGSGELTFLSAPLAGQHDWYIKEQLEKFKFGHRGGKKGDVSGDKMALVMSSNFSDNEVKDIIAFLNTLDYEKPRRDE